MNNQTDLIEIKYPKPFEYVGAKFSVSGWVHLSWFESDITGMSDWSIYVDYLALDSKTFMGTTVSPKLDDQNMRGDKVWFTIDCELNAINIPFIQKSHGRVTLKVDSPNSKIPAVYLPLIVKQFETTLTDEEEIKKMHSEVGNKEVQYEQDLRNYNEEMRKVYESRKAKDGGKKYQHLHGESAMLGFEIFKLLEEYEEVFKDYTYDEEDRREEELNEQYIDALEWRGPLAEGIVSRFGGFELRVYSDDHDRHFHVIHRDKGIDARFSFPDMQLINYKSSKTTIGSKAEKKIREYCVQPDILKKFEEEFGKRG
jgi:hypothetical protein